MLTDSEVKRLLDIANAGVNKGEIAAARRIYEGILAGRPDHVPTLVSSALSRIAAGEYAEAEALLKDRVLADHPDDADALVYLGLSMHLSGRCDEALEVFARIPEGTPAKTLADNLVASDR